MSKREFSKVSPAIWRSKRFINLPDDRTRLLLLYYMTCQHQNSAGAYRVPEGYVLADLGWEIDEYRRARGNLVDVDFIAYDDETEEIFVKGWFKVCPPMNDKHASGTMSRISEIESDAIREVLEVEFTAVNKARLVTQIKGRRGAGAEY